MRHVDDLHEGDKKIIRALELLDKVDTSDRNKKIVKSFAMACKREGLSKITVASYIQFTKRIIESLHACGYTDDIDRLEEYDFDEFIMYAEETKGLSLGTIHNYKKTFKKLYAHLYGDAVPKWVQKMKLRKPKTPVEPSDLLTQEEFDSLMHECTHPRDKAMIATMADSGMRIGALATCRVKHVEFNQWGGIIYVSGTSKSKKTLDAKGIPLTWSTGYLNQWLSVHPLKEDPDAPLWVTLDKNRSPLSYSAIQFMLRDTAKRAGIKKRVNPHSFRHFAITNWILDGLNEQEIKHRAGWARGSTAMFEVYGNFTDQDMNNRIFEKYGLKTDERKVTLKQCPRCNNILRPTDKFCSQCSLVLDRNTYEEMQEYDKLMPEFMQMLMRTEEGRKMLSKMRKE